MNGFSLYRITGTSMAPSLRGGARVFVSTRGRKRVGDVVVLRPPSRPDVVSVKRIVEISEDGYFVEGDKLNASTDSRRFGRIPADAILGKVIFQYSPTFRWYL